MTKFAVVLSDDEHYAVRLCLQMETEYIQACSERVKDPCPLQVAWSNALLQVLKSAIESMKVSSGEVMP